MADDILWRREPHTEGKHLVLRAYLDAWLPILGSRNERILVIDGFAGPGEYEGGGDGSPIIALRSLIEHNARKKISGEVVFIFIEKHEARAKHLDGLVEALRTELPANADVSVVHGSFDQSMTEVLDALDAQKARMAPAFVMIDPFGVSGTPMSVIARIMENPKCEVYVSFMYESMNRFISTETFAPHLDELFGTSDWRAAVDMQGADRQKYLYQLYERQLRKAGAEHVVHFDLYEGNRLVYAIFFGTQHWLGCDKMKRAIWKVAPSGDFSFRGSKSDQLILGVEAPNLAPLREQLIYEFGDGEWVGIEDVVKFVGSDRTEYHTSQLKKQVLKPLEAEGVVEADEGTRSRKGTYPKGCRIRFRLRDG